MKDPYTPICYAIAMVVFVICVVVWLYRIFG